MDHPLPCVEGAKDTAGGLDDRASVRFGEFVLYRSKRRLVRDGEDIRIGGRAWDLLNALLDARGSPVSRDDIERKVWPGLKVEETNLRVHIASLRKTLGDGAAISRFIETVPGRGYRFASRFSVEPEDESEAPNIVGWVNAAAIPSRPAVVVGRQDALRDLQTILAKHRLTTITGPGGIGKTTLALEAAEKVGTKFPHGTCFVDLSTINDTDSLAASFAMALGLYASGDRPWPSIRAHLRHKKMLVVIDNCEHLRVPAAKLVQGLLDSTAHLAVLATSHEPLELAMEMAYQLGPLSTDAPHAVDAPAVQLFMNRVSAAAGARWAPTDEQLRSVRALCEQVEGVPLSIELAAGQASSLDLEEISKTLEVALDVISGPRGAAPRHRNLQALMDWSYALLSANEQEVLTRLAVFRGAFSFDDAVATAKSVEVTEEGFAGAVHRLKSIGILRCDRAGSLETYRLRFATRVYAERILKAGPDERATRQKHAHAILSRLKLANAALREVDIDDLPLWHARYAPLIDEVRAALLHVGEAPGGAPLELALAISAELPPFFMEFGLTIELHGRLAKALRMLPENCNGAIELCLLAASCFATVVTGYMQDLHPRIEERILELIPQARDVDLQVEGLYALVVRASHRGDHPVVLRHLEKLAKIMRGSREHGYTLLVQRFRGFTNFSLGRFASARHQLDEVQRFQSKKLLRHFSGHTPRKMSVAIYRSRLEWIQGRSAEADAALRDGLEANDNYHVLGVPAVLGHAAIPLAIWQGRIQRAHALVLELQSVISRLGHHFFTPFLKGYASVLERHGLHVDLDEEASPPAPQHAEELFATLNEALFAPSCLARVNSGEVGWCAAELLRVSAVRTLRAHPDDGAAEDMLFRAIQLAQDQGALAWELRATISLTELWVARDFDSNRGVKMLAGVMGKFREGFDDTDFCRAKALLVRLEGNRYG